MMKIKLPIKFEALVTRKNPNGFNEILALRRVPNDGGFWQPVTGTLESDESFEDCIIRELEEETGIKSSDILHASDCFFQFTWERAGTVYHEYVFHIEVNPKTVVALSDEHDAYQWVSFDQSRTLYEKDNNKNAVTKLEEFLKESR